MKSGMTTPALCAQNARAVIKWDFSISAFLRVLRSARLAAARPAYLCTTVLYEECSLMHAAMSVIIAVFPYRVVRDASRAAGWSAAG
jgi:hypothetical protein